MRILTNVLILLSISSHPVTSSSSSPGVLLCGGSMTDHLPYLVTCEVGWTLDNLNTYQWPLIKTIAFKDIFK